MNFCHCQEAISANSLRFLYTFFSLFLCLFFNLLFCLSLSLPLFHSHCVSISAYCIFFRSLFLDAVRFGEYFAYETMMNNNNNILNITDKSFAVAIVIASLAGPQWLLTEEKIRNPNFNGTINYNNAIDDGMYILKTTKSSLWILCFAQGNFPSRFSPILNVILRTIQ